MLSGLRNFFITLLIFLIVFGLIAYFLIGYISGMGKEPEDSPNNIINGNEVTNNVIEQHDPNEFYRFSVLIAGIDNGNSQNPDESNDEAKKKEADAIILVDINSQTGVFMTTYLSRDMKVDARGYTLRLGAVYAEFGAETLVKTVKSYTGIQPDYYCVLSYDGLSKLIDTLGGIEYNIPENMYYVPELYDKYTKEKDDEGNWVEKVVKPEINLNKGMQNLNGEQVIEFLRYVGYANKESGRIEAHKNFINEFVKQFINANNLLNIKIIFDGMRDSITETNISTQNVADYAGLFAQVLNFERREINYPGQIREDNGIDFYMPDIMSAVRMFKEYRKVYAQ